MKRRYKYLKNYDVENDGFVTKEEDLIAKNTHFAEGFERKDKPFLEGYVRGLEVAMRFCEAEGATAEQIKEKISNVAFTLECEIEWLF